MSTENEQRGNRLVKKLKKYALIGSSAIALLFGNAEAKRQESARLETSPITQTIKTNHADMDVSKKIDYMVDHMWEKSGDPTYAASDLQDFKKVTSPEKKDRIRQNLQTYASVPLGHELLSKLDISKIHFTDTLKPSGTKQGEFDPTIGSLSMDFEDPNGLATMHHELTHALQYQKGSVTSKGKLNEIDAFLSGVKYTQQAVSKGIPMQDSGYIEQLYNYQKYGENDVEYIKNFLYPELSWRDSYNKKFKDADSYGYAATKDDFRAYARSLGANEEGAESFAETLTQNSLKKVEYGRSPNGGEFKKTLQGDTDSIYENLTERFGPDGNKIETIKSVFEKGSDGNYTVERFGPDDKKIETVKRFKDANGNRIKVIEKENGPDKVTTKYVNGTLENDANVLKAPVSNPEPAHGLKDMLSKATFKSSMGVVKAPVLKPIIPKQETGDKKTGIQQSGEKTLGNFLLSRRSGYDGI